MKKKYTSRDLAAELSLCVLLENPFGQCEPAVPAVSSSNLLPILQLSHWGMDRLGKQEGFAAVQSLFSNTYQHCLSHRSKTAQQGLLWRKSTAAGLRWCSFCCVHWSSPCLHIKLYWTNQQRKQVYTRFSDALEKNAVKVTGQISSSLGIKLEGKRLWRWLNANRLSMVIIPISFMSSWLYCTQLYIR